MGQAASHQPRAELDAGPGVDRDARCTATYQEVCAEAGLDPALAEVLYAVESDAALDAFADVLVTLQGLRARECAWGW